MPTIKTVAEMKAQARTLRASQGIKHSKALEIVAKANGYRDWNTAVALAPTPLSRAELFTLVVDALKINPGVRTSELTARLDRALPFRPYDRDELAGIVARGYTTNMQLAGAMKSVPVTKLPEYVDQKLVEYINFRGMTLEEEEAEANRFSRTPQRLLERAAVHAEEHLADVEQDGIRDVEAEERVNRLGEQIAVAEHWIDMEELGEE